MVDDHHLLEVLEDQGVHQEDLLEQVGILGTAMGCSLDIDAVVAGQDAADPFDRVVVADIVLNSRVLDYWVDIPAKKMQRYLKDVLLILNVSSGFT